MSEPASPPPSSPPRYTGGEIAIMLIGGVLLLPGLCSLFFVIGAASEWRSGDPILQALLALWMLCFTVSGGGIALIWLAPRNARARAS